MIILVKSLLGGYWVGLIIYFSIYYFFVTCCFYNTLIYLFICFIMNPSLYSFFQSFIHSFTHPFIFFDVFCGLMWGLDEYFIANELSYLILFCLCFLTQPPPFSFPLHCKNLIFKGCIVLRITFLPRWDGGGVILNELREKWLSKMGRIIFKENINPYSSKILSPLHR